MTVPPGKPMNANSTFAMRRRRLSPLTLEIDTQGSAVAFAHRASSRRGRGIIQRALGTTTRRRGRRQGLAMAEMAIICPLMLLLAFATTDFGRVIYAYVTVSNAARVGAEYGALHGFTSYSQATWQSQMRQAIDYEMQGLPGYQPANLQVAITTTTDAAGIAQVKVELTYPFNTIINWAGIPSAVTLDHAVEMRRRQ